jgi:hypothetical protein
MVRMFPHIHRDRQITGKILVSNEELVKSLLCLIRVSSDTSAIPYSTMDLTGSELDQWEVGGSNCLRSDLNTAALCFSNQSSSANFMNAIKYMFNGTVKTIYILY